MAKKKSKKKPAAPGVDPNELRRQRLEARREAKARALAAQQRRQTRERWIRRGVYALLFAGAVWFLFLRGAPPSEINGNPVLAFSTQGSGQHTNDAVSYESDPPVSGQHDFRSAPCGVYGTPPDKEQMVHTLEHGAVGILYSPTLETDAIKQIEAVVRDYDSHVFSAPYEGLDPAVATIAWGYMMRLNEADVDSITQFVDAFRKGGDAPEANQACPNDLNDPFQATPEPQPSPTGEPEPSPTEEAGAGDDKKKD